MKYPALLWCVCATSLCLLAGGCGSKEEKSPMATNALAISFSSAEQPVREVVERAVKQMQAGDYEGAARALEGLRAARKVNAEQARAIKETIEKFPPSSRLAP